jgi:hypothetical protein
MEGGNIDTDGSTSKKRTHPEDFKRAYKACINCRQRKAKCILGTGPDGGELKPPCQRCKREMRECVFRSERSWVKRRKPGEDREEEDEINDISTDTGPETKRPTPVQTPSISAHGITPGSQRSGPFSSVAQHLRQISASQPDLAHAVMRTVVSSGSDALNLLFEAANHRDAMEHQEQNASQAYDTPKSGPSGYEGGVPASPFHTFRAQPVQMSTPSPETLRIWTSCRFVQMGWFSAHEAVTYVDLFFKNCSPLSPILGEFYAQHENHYSLIALDPFLCTTILMISSRYNILPGVGGASRGYFVHDRLWEQCQRFIMKIMLGQVKPSKAQSRTIGSIEALLLLSEWHPRALHFPTAADGWDCELMIGANNTTEEGSKLLEGDATSNRWLEDVIEPAKRSDRMSWMLMGCALSLAQELGLFEDNATINKDQISYSNFTSEYLVIRRIRARKLLYVLLEQLSWRLGCTSMIPQSLNHALMEKIPVDSATGAVEQWQSFMSAWVELTKLARSVSDTIYPSAATTRSLLRTGRYIGLLEHFQPLLVSWRKKYLDPCSKSEISHVRGTVADHNRTQSWIARHAAHRVSVRPDLHQFARHAGCCRTHTRRNRSRRTPRRQPLVQPRAQRLRLYTGGCGWELSDSRKGLSALGDRCTSLLARQDISAHYHLIHIPHQRPELGLPYPQATIIARYPGGCHPCPTSE